MSQTSRYERAGRLTCNISNTLSWFCIDVRRTKEIILCPPSFRGYILVVRTEACNKLARKTGKKQNV